MQKGPHIIFVGFMGSGKTTVSRSLARRHSLPMLDVDTRIEQLEGRSIKRIFAEDGEAAFRSIETRALAGIADLGKCVVSCGGGVVGNPANREVLKTLGTVVYLKIGCEEAIGRISDPSTRPMLSGPRPVAEIYRERLPLYEEVADITVDVGGGTREENYAAVEAALLERGLL